MKTKTNICTVLGLLTTVACAKPFTSVKIGTAQTKDAVYYALPRTTIIVEAELAKIETKTPKCVEVTKAARKAAKQAAQEESAATSTTTPAPAKSKKPQDPKPEPLHKQFAAAGLDLDDLPTERGIVVGQSKLAMSTGARPDPNHIYAIKLEGKTGHERKLALELGVDSVLASGSVSAENHTGELAAKVVVDTLAAVAKIVGSLFGGRAVAKIDDVSSPEWEICSEALDRLATLAKKRQRIVDATTSLADVADYVRLLDAERLLLQQLFSGEKKMSTGKIRCVVDPSDPADPATPPTGTIPDTKLWALHKTEGIVIAKPSECVATAEFVTSSPKTPGRDFGLRISTEHDINAHAAKIYANRANSDSEAVIHYRVPGRASVAVVEGENNVLAPETMIIAQYGVTMALPVPVGNKKVEAGYKIDPKTGALVKVEITSGGKTSVPDIGKLGDAVNTVATTAKEARETTQDEVVQQLLLDACHASLKAGEISTACGLL